MQNEPRPAEIPQGGVFACLGQMGGWHEFALRLYGRALQKPSPWGEGGAPARRMRGKCPADAPSSVTCGDSFPQRGKPYRRFTRKFHVAFMSRAGLAPPLPRNDFCCPVGRGDPTPPGKWAVVTNLPFAAAYAARAKVYRQYKTAAVCACRQRLLLFYSYCSRKVRPSSLMESTMARLASL